MSFGPCWFSSLWSATVPLEHVIAVQRSLSAHLAQFVALEVSVGKAAVTEIQYRLKGHLVLDEVGMSEANLLHILPLLLSGWGTGRVGEWDS